MEFSLLPDVFHCHATHPIGGGRAGLFRRSQQCWRGVCGHLAASHWQRPSACHILPGIRWHLMSRNSSLTLSLRAVLSHLLLVLAQGKLRKVLWTLLQMSSFPQKKGQVNPWHPHWVCFPLLNFRPVCCPNE